MTVSAHRDEAHPDGHCPGQIRGGRGLRHAVRPGRGRPGQRRGRARLGGAGVPARRDGRQAGRHRRPAATGLGAAGPGGLPGGAPPGGAGRGPGGGHRPGPGHRHRHRLHRVHGAARAARRHPAVPAARPGRPPARLRQAVEAPRRPAAGGPDQRAGARARRAVDRPVRRQDLRRVAVRQGAATARRGPGDLRPGRALDRGGRLDHLAALRHRDPQRLHRRVQGHLPGRPLPVAGLPGRAEPAVRQLRRGQAGPPGRPARRAGRRADRRGGRLDRPAGRHRGRGGQRGRARHPARGQRHRARPDGGHHGHLDLSRDERRHAGRGARHVRGGGRRHRGRRVRLRGRAERCR